MSLSPQNKPLLGFAAYSGTGKTTLLETLIPELSKLEIRTAVIKHSHHDFEIDYEGKDSYRLRKAGANQMLIASPYRQALISEFDEPSEPVLPSLLQQLNPDMVDMILVEGFRHYPNLPKIELHRPELSKPLLFPQDQQIIAIASNADQSLLQTFSCAPPLLPLDEPATIASFIKHYFRL